MPQPAIKLSRLRTQSVSAARASQASSQAGRADTPRAWRVLAKRPPPRIRGNRTRHTPIAGARMRANPLSTLSDDLATALVPDEPGATRCEHAAPPAADRDE